MLIYPTKWMGYRKFYEWTQYQSITNYDNVREYPNGIICIVGVHCGSLSRKLNAMCEWNQWKTCKDHLEANILWGICPCFFCPLRLYNSLPASIPVVLFPYSRSQIMHAHTATSSNIQYMLYKYDLIIMSMIWLHRSIKTHVQFGDHKVVNKSVRYISVTALTDNRLSANIIEKEE